MVLEHWNISMVTIPQINWQEVEKLATLKAREPSLAFLTGPGADPRTRAGCAFLPVLLSRPENGIEYP